MKITDKGISIDTYSDIVAELTSGYQAVYGDDINLESNTPDGQKLGIEAKARLDMEQAILDLANNFDPDTARGYWLDSLVKLAGLNRKAPTHSSAELTVTVTEDMILSAGYTVSDVNHQSWQTLEDYTLSAGANTITVHAVNAGEIQAQAGTINNPTTILTHVVSVTNHAPATPGRDEETDEELRIRRGKSTESSSQSMIGSLLARLWNLEGVTDVGLEENKSNNYDQDKDMQAHSIWAIVRGGDALEIATAIAQERTGGCGMKGDIAVNVPETVPKPDGTTMTLTQVVRFDRPADVMLFIKMDVAKVVETQAVDTYAIKERLSALTFMMNAPLSATSLYSSVYAGSQGNFVAEHLQISRDGGVTWTGGELSTTYGEIFKIIPENITITEVP